MRNTKNEPEFVYHQLHAFGVLLWCTGALRLHADGCSPSYVCRWYHPVTWLLFILMVIPCAVMGEKLTDVVPVRLKPFWVENSDQLRWVNPWTRLSDIKPFNHGLALEKRKAREEREAREGAPDSCF